MPIGIGAALLISGAATAGATAYSAYKQSSAANKAAELQTQAASHASDVQAKGASDALDFQKQQAALDQARFEATQRANYDQWAARQSQLSNLGQLAGLPARNIPAYVPTTLAGTGTTPAATATTTGSTTLGSTPVPGGDYKSWFMNLVAGKPWNQQTLLSLQPTLNQYGVKLTPPNAMGDQTKIGLPNGQWVRVGFGEGQPVWIPQNAPGTSAPVGSMASMGSLAGLPAFPFYSAYTPPGQTPRVNTGSTFGSLM